MDKIVVLDFGSQYSHLICRRIRDFSVYAELVPYNISLEELKKLNLKINSLIINKIHKPGTNMVSNLGYSIEVIDVYEDHAICKLLKKDKPWKRIKVGHRLRIHE